MVANSDSDDVLDNIKEKLQIVLNRNFKTSYRRKIDVYPDRLNFCCPICGDSATDGRKKRGNLYLNSMSYHCYNCGAHYGINSLLKRFGEELSADDRILVSEIQQSSKQFERKSRTHQSSMTLQVLSALAVPKSVFFKSNHLVTPYKNDFCSSYLKGRKIDIRSWKFFAFKESTKELYILNTNENDRIIGYQVRQLDKKSKKARYLTTSMSRMYRDIFGKDLSSIIGNVLSKMDKGNIFIEEEDGVDNIVASVDRLSGLFNIMNINTNMPLTIVEGPIDSLAVDNCIALQGATKMNNYFDNMKDVRYLFDNDKVGKEHSIKKLREHKSVFLWGKYIKEVKPKQKIKDLNDLQKSDNFKLDVFERCFSDDELDIIDI